MKAELLSYNKYRFTTGTGKLRDSFPELKRSEREVNHSPFSSTKVKSEWSYTSAPPISFVEWTGKIHLSYLYRKITSVNFSRTQPYISKRYIFCGISAAALKSVAVGRRGHDTDRHLFSVLTAQLTLLCCVFGVREAVVLMLEQYPVPAGVM
jgi:hypothetical protein